eukprot:gene6068-7558_t
MIPLPLGSLCEYNSPIINNNNNNNNTSSNIINNNNNNNINSSNNNNITSPSLSSSSSSLSLSTNTSPSTSLKSSLNNINSNSNIKHLNNNNTTIIQSPLLIGNNNNNNNNSPTSLSSSQTPHSAIITTTFRNPHLNIDSLSTSLTYNPLKYLYEQQQQQQSATSPQLQSDCNSSNNTTNSNFDSLSSSPIFSPLSTPTHSLTSSPPNNINNNNNNNSSGNFSPIFLSCTPPSSDINQPSLKDQLNNSSNNNNFESIDNNNNNDPNQQQQQQRKRSISFSIKNLNILSHQVAGQAPLLKLPDGKILKPLVLKEYQFYKSIEYHSEFHGFTPKFYGVLDLKHVDYEYLEESFKSLHHTFDYNHWKNKIIKMPKNYQNYLKMGTRQYGSDAPFEKMRSMEEKCRSTTSSSLGFRVCGLKIFDQKTGFYSTYDKYYGRKLKDNDISTVICKFVDNGLRYRVENKKFLSYVYYSLGTSLLMGVGGYGTNL